VVDNSDNIFKNSILSTPGNKPILSSIKDYLSQIKKQAFDDKSIIITNDNILTLLSMQFSLFKDDFDKLSFDIKLKTFTLFFSRYINRKEVAVRFKDFDSTISLTQSKKMQQYLNR
jgi:hypothetical protein